MVAMKQRQLLQLVCACLAVLLAILVAFALWLTVQEGSEMPEIRSNATVTTAPTTEPTAVPTTEPATVPTTVPTTAPVTKPTTAPTTEPTTEPAAEPQSQRFVLTFAGDCAFGNLQDVEDNEGFIGKIGDDYDYPFANVVEYFQNDDCTFINLECVLTDAEAPEDRLFALRGKPVYTEILVRGSVEFANVANNHRMDYGWNAYEDTMNNLSAAGVHYADSECYTVFTTDSGLRIGVFASSSGLTWQQITDAVTAMRAEGAELIVASMHWGYEYWYEPNEMQIGWARLAIDAGVDIVYGHHTHVLQPVEEYNGGIIYYSLGNFSFGGNGDPADKDTAILQQEAFRDPDGTIRLGELVTIPCSVSGINPGNDYRPVLLDPESDAYQRVLTKLDGTYPEQKLENNYREDLN